MTTTPGSLPCSATQSAFTSISGWAYCWNSGALSAATGMGPPWGVRRGFPTNIVGFVCLLVARAWETGVVTTPALQRIVDLFGGAPKDLRTQALLEYS